MVKVFVEPPIENFCMMRISRALKNFAPSNIEFVNDEKDADLVILYIHGQRKRAWWTLAGHKKEGRECAIVQLQLKNSVNPATADWLKVWENAKLTWSYYDLPFLCEEEGNKVNFNFYHAPLGVDCEVFKEANLEKKYIIGIHSKGWSRESLQEVVTAARKVGKKVLNFESPKDYGEGVDFTGILKDDDAKMAQFYSQCKYVSGLRRVEGFELPVIEGLMCGARPICYDLPSYRMWFNGLAEFIPDEGRAKSIPALVELFKKEPRSVSNDEKEFVKTNFNWEVIAKGFWNRI
jgi:hypothetical protein